MRHLTIMFFVFVGIMSVSLFLHDQLVGKFMFLVGTVGVGLYFLLRMRETEKLYKYWNRCRSRSDDLMSNMIKSACNGDFAAADQFRRRNARVIELWGRSIDNGAIPKEPDLDDL